MFVQIINYYRFVHFRTDSSGPKGKGFKIIITAYNDGKFLFRLNVFGLLRQAEMCHTGILLLRSESLHKIAKIVPRFSIHCFT